MPAVSGPSPPSGRLSFGVARGPLAAPINAALRRLLHLDDINRIYAHARPAPGDPGLFQRILDQVGIGYRVNPAELERIPPTGPAIVVANHPFGLPEGIILGALLGRVRPDAKIMVNFLLGDCEEMRDHFILVNPFRASIMNHMPLRECIRWLAGGGMLAVFPAGEVSHLDLRAREVADPPWSDTAARLMRLSQASVVPVFFKGANSLSFQLLGVVHPRLRTLRIFHEMLAMRGKEVELRIGKPIRNQTLRELGDDWETTVHLRARTYLLGSAGQQIRKNPLALPRQTGRRAPEPVADRTPEAQIEAEIDSLPAERRLAACGDFEVLLADARLHPALLREIGRLREITFRAAGEGTNRALDLDRFDDYYEHLVLWHRGDRRIAGGYRMGSTAAILPRLGIQGLYTSTLFDFDPEFFGRIGPALETGRSFVTREYQRHYQSLMMLWKGIGAYVCRKPEHKVLFGPVSISNDYRFASRQVLAASLSANCPLAELQPLVEPKRPFRVEPIRGMRSGNAPIVIGDLDELSAIIADIEPDGKGIPILIRQYLKLGGKLLGFNLDPAFSNALDGLILVDLSQTSPAILERYMGRAEAAAFRAYEG